MKYLTLALLMLISCNTLEKSPPRPNILLIITDDQSWEHLGCYGDSVVQTPAIDGLALKGLRFEHAYTACPSCSPARAALLTGQDIYRLEEGGVLTGFIRDKFQVFPLLLEKSGYHVGYTGKGYWPRTKDVPGTIEEPFGKGYNQVRLDSVPYGVSGNDYVANFSQFMEEGGNQPFFFMAGLGEPHRPYSLGLGVREGIDTARMKVPAFLPNVPIAKVDLADYLLEVERCDQVVENLVDVLTSKGLMENTLIVFTSDNGMPFPRAKATLYDHGVRMPLIACWKDHVGENLIVKDPVSLMDLAPTFLALAGVDIPDQYTGRNIIPLLFSKEPEVLETQRDYVVTAFEKHTHCRPHEVGYPRRAIHTGKWTYIVNYEPDRYPMGNLDIYIPNWDNLGDCDPGPTKTYFKEEMNNSDFQDFWDLSFGKIPREELFNKEEDPYMIHNLSGDPAHELILADLKIQLMDYLSRTNDPRMEDRSPWDHYRLDK